MDRVDVAIVGSGPAGVAAAMAANDAGASWMGVEARDMLGGTAVLAGGGCCFAGTSTQRALGIEDSPGLALQDLLADNDDLDRDWANYYFERSTADVHDWLLRQGVRFEHLRHCDELAEFQSVPRWHQPEGAGAKLMAILHDGLRRDTLRTRLGRFVTNTRVMEGVRTSERASRLIVESPSGTSCIEATAFVFATGGFNSNVEMVRLNAVPFARGAFEVLCGGGPGAIGEGHRLLANEGASLVNMDHLWCYLYALPDHDDVSQTRGFAIWGIPDNVWVTSEGIRFHDESLRGAGSAMPVFRSLTTPRCFSIIDRRMADTLQVIDPRYRLPDGTINVERREQLLSASPHVARANTLHSLAIEAGITPGALVETIESWNALVCAGVARDPQTGRRTIGVSPIARPPFYALRFVPLARKNLGGVRTDLRCRILNQGGRPLTGLYGAGELCGFGGGRLGGSKPLEGMMIGGSLFSGRVAGAWAAHEAGRPAPLQWQ
ncbi:MAG: FAD-binding dehydrogenase [Polyangiales bacterium]